MKIHHLQLEEAFACRSYEQSCSPSVRAIGSWPRKWSVIVFIDYTRWGKAVFGMAPIPFAVWLFILPFPFALLGLEELRK